MAVFLNTIMIAVLVGAALTSPVLWVVIGSWACAGLLAAAILVAAAQ